MESGYKFITKIKAIKKDITNGKIKKKRKDEREQYSVPVGIKIRKNHLYRFLPQKEKEESNQSAGCTK